MKKISFIILISLILFNCTRDKFNVKNVKNIVFKLETSVQGENYLFTIPKNDYKNVFNAIANSQKSKNYKSTDELFKLSGLNAKIIIKYNNNDIDEYVYKDSNVVYHAQESIYMESNNFTYFFTKYLLQIWDYRLKK